MLRRAPTTITLTAADLEAYEAARQRKLWEKQQQQNGDFQSSSGSDKGSGSIANEQGKLSQKDRILGGQGRRQGN